MTVKRLLAILAGVMLSAPSPAQGPGLSAYRDEPAIAYNAVALIECGEYVGTAFWIAPNRIVTANHVSGDRTCSIGGIPLRRVRANVLQDVAEFTGIASPAYLRVRCRAPRNGDVIHTVGYPMGQVRHTSRLVATAARDDGRWEPIARGMLEMRGRSYPGMSGGPMVDRQGNVVAMLSRGRAGPDPATWGRVLRDSFICRH